MFDREHSRKTSIHGHEGSYPRPRGMDGETLHVCSASTYVTMRAHTTCTARFRPTGRLARTVRPSRPLRSVSSRAKKVEIEDLDGTVHVVQVEEGETILEAALDAGVDAPHDCKMGVCMTCPSRLVRGNSSAWEAWHVAVV